MKSALLVGVVGAACSLPAAAQFAKPSDAIHYRQAVMTVMATHFGRVAAMAQGKAPYDAKVAADNAAVAEAMSRLPFDAFGPGTDKGAPTRAKDEVWSDAKDFQDNAKEMQQAMAKFAASARSGGLDGIKGTVGDLGQACKDCHDDYRSKDPVTR